MLWLNVNCVSCSWNSFLVIISKKWAFMELLPTRDCLISVYVKNCVGYLIYRVAPEALAPFLSVCTRGTFPQKITLFPASQSRSWFYISRANANTNSGSGRDKQDWELANCLLQLRPEAIYTVRRWWMWAMEAKLTLESRPTESSCPRLDKGYIILPQAC